MVQDAHEIAELLYENHKPIDAIQAGLFLMWFSVFAEISAESASLLKNKNAWAGAIEYVWHRLRSEKVTKQELAKRYGISSATIGKYVKMVNTYLN
jgi:hypothetical protein